MLPHASLFTSFKQDELPSYYPRSAVGQTEKVTNLKTGQREPGVEPAIAAPC